MKNRKQQGFTLIELMITVAIIGILAGIALPAYDKYIIRSNRAAAQSVMMELANRNQQYFLSNRNFTTSISSDLNYTVPSKLGAKYNAPTITLGRFLDSSCSVEEDTGTMPSYVITFTPLSTSSQAADGALHLSSTGVKCPAGKW